MDRLSAAVPERPGLGYHRVLAWMCALIAVNQLGFGSIMPVVALYARSFGVSQSAIGLAIGVFGLARFLVAVPAAQISDRFGRRTALALGGIIAASGNLLCAWAPGYATFVGARFVTGVGASLVLITGQVVLADITRPAYRGRAMAIYQGVFLFSVGIGPVPGGFLAESYGLSAPFVGCAVAGAVVSAIAWFRVPETRPAIRDDSSEPLAPALPVLAQVRMMTGQIGFVLVSLVAFTNAFGRAGALFNVIPILAQDRLSLTAGQIGLGLALANIVGVALAYPSGVLVDRYGRKAVIVPATILAGLSMTFFLLATSYAGFLGACVSWSLAVGVSGAAPAAYAADSAPPGMNAAAMSTFRALADLGYVIGPIALGIAVDLSGPASALLTAGALLIAVGAVFARFAPETYRRPYPFPEP